MDRYTDKVVFQKNSIGKISESFSFDSLEVPIPFPLNPIWSRLGTMFDVEHFTYSAPPPDVGKILLDLSNTDGLRVLRCPIKIAGNPNFVLPQELISLKPLIRHVSEIVAYKYPEVFHNFWCHVSFEKTYVEANKTQRVPGWHVDGFQGVRVPRHRIEHSWLWTDGPMTEFCIQPFFIEHLHPGRHDIFSEFTKQAKECNAYKGISNHVYLIDPYVVHRSPIILESMTRSFVRITFTETELLDPMNTVNLSLECEQNYPNRIDARNRLHPYEGSIPWIYHGIIPVK